MAGPALVKAAIGQDIDQETLGGATTHAAISGTADFHEKDDVSAISRTRTIIRLMNISNKISFNNKIKEPLIYGLRDFSDLSPNKRIRHCKIIGTILIFSFLTTFTISFIEKYIKRKSKK